MASGERDLTRGSVWRQVLAYAMPLVASSLLQALYSMVDTVIAGHFAGSAAISAINNSGQILNILTKIAIGITTGGNIIIGQYYGAKEQGRLGEASGTLLSLSLLLGAATAVGLYAGAYPLLGLLGAPAMEQSVAYLRICAVGMVFVFGYNALSAVLRGVGDSRTPLLIIGVATVVNTVLDLWFVAGLGMGTRAPRLPQLPRRPSASAWRWCWWRGAPGCYSRSCRFSVCTARCSGSFFGWASPVHCK